MIAKQQDVSFISFTYQEIIFYLFPLIGVMTISLLGCYKNINRYFSLIDLIKLAKAITIYTFLTIFMTFLLHLSQNLNLTNIIVLKPFLTLFTIGVFGTNWFFSIVLLSCTRLFMKFFLVKNQTDNKDMVVTPKKVLVIGVGDDRSLINLLANKEDIIVVGIIDQDNSIAGGQLFGINVFKPKMLEYIIESEKVEEIIIASEKITPEEENNILGIHSRLNIKITILPNFDKILTGLIKVGEIFEFSDDELLNREKSEINQTIINNNIEGKNILVTGAAGSIGSELCKQIIGLNPKKLIAFDHNEYGLYKLEKDLRSKTDAENIFPILGSVTNREIIDETIKKFKIENIYHAAAYKHVPLIESNHVSGCLNNILGTYYLTESAIKNNVKTFILISTDKAVRPASFMGASKRFSELILQAFDGHDNNGTIFSMVRFGNVLGSSGSVSQLFTEQIKHGGPLTVTDEKMVRYFMSISEAVHLVLNAGALAEGGEVFLLDMGEPIEILELAKLMIKLAGKNLKDENNPNGDIEIIFTGERGGEKLYEELLIDTEAEPTKHPKIFQSREKFIAHKEIIIGINEIEESSYDIEKVEMYNLLKKYIPEFKIN